MNKLIESVSLIGSILNFIFMQRSFTIMIKKIIDNMQYLDDHIEQCLLKANLNNNIIVMCEQNISHVILNILLK